MGPTRLPTELRSDFRWRYAVYCLKWVMGSGAALAIAWLAFPLNSPPTLANIPVILGLGATITAFIAFLAYSVGGLWARWLERSVRRDRVWHRIKIYCAFLMVLGVIAWTFHQVAYGVVTGKIIFPSHRIPIVSYENDKYPFLFAIGFWMWSSALFCWVAWRARIAVQQPNNSFKADGPNGPPP
jgi:hypothetical protein